MPIPISYNYRNLLARRLTTFLTAAGMALVVFVFAAADDCKAQALEHYQRALVPNPQLAVAAEAAKRLGAHSIPKAESKPAR
jgi:hypothetical protein